MRTCAIRTDPRSIGDLFNESYSMDLGSGKFNLKLKNKIQPLVEAPSFKLHAGQDLKDTIGLISMKFKLVATFNVT